MVRKPHRGFVPIYYLRFCIACACVGLMSAPADLFADVATTKDTQRAALQAQLNQVQLEIQQNQLQLDQQQKQRQTYERDVNVLNGNIKKAQLEIRQRDLTLGELSDGIADKQQGIQNVDAKVVQSQVSLAHILRGMHQMDDRPMAELALSGSLSDLFSDFDAFETIQKAMGVAFVTMANQRTDLTVRKQVLEDQKQETQDLRQIQVLQQQRLQSTQGELKQLVAVAKGHEADYKRVISAKQQTAAQIEAALFALRDTKSVTFGNIYEFAKEASAKTGVRPAVVLGILAEESNLGQNVGKGNWHDDMNPTRDAPVFATICSSLGLNPDSQPVSKRQWYGWGGAMGPAQFIPSTWQQYTGRISVLTGQQPANPWDPRTAAFAAALLMQDNGADSGSRSAERLAALRYLAGWKNAGKAAYAFYGDDVMALADKFQQQIAILGG